VAEYELSRRGIGSHQTHYEEALLFSWMTAGFEAYAAARDAGYPAYMGRGRRGDGSFLGDPREGVIVLPTPALEEAYRRCAPPTADGIVGPAGRDLAPRLCECGCGEPVRRRFLPGHDAKLRSRLLRHVRAGSAARQQLARLGWAAYLTEE